MTVKLRAGVGPEFKEKIGRLAVRLVVRNSPAERATSFVMGRSHPWTAELQLSVGLFAPIFLVGVPVHDAPRISEVLSSRQ